MMSPELHQQFTGCRSTNGLRGGQELLLPEIMASLNGCDSVWIPFYSSGTLVDCLLKSERAVYFDTDTPLLDCPKQVDALYFGTPTIVDDKPLFYDPQTIGWNKQKERETVRAFLQSATRNRCKRIIAGLGSGDISLEERLEDMDGGSVVCFKRFDSFSDWLIVKDLQ